MPHTGLDGASHPSPSTSSLRFPDRSQTTLNRTCNGWASRRVRDWALNKISGMRGRLIAQSVSLIGEGILLIVFSKQKTIGAAIPCLVAFSFFVQATEGTSFGIVPYICPEGLGGVCAVVGAWGNIGAVCWGMMFKFGYIGKFDKGYEAMGYIIIASSVFSIFMRIKGQKTMFGTLEDQ